MVLRPQQFTWKEEELRLVASSTSSWGDSACPERCGAQLAHRPKPEFPPLLSCPRSGLILGEGGVNTRASLPEIQAPGFI